MRNTASKWKVHALAGMLVVMIVALLAFGSCQNDKIVGDPALRGKWVEVTGGTDTIAFTSMGDTPVLNLSRGKELVDGELLFKHSAGSYYYKLGNSGISLLWFASSSTTWHDYLFDVDGDTFVVGNFYDIDHRGRAEQFRRIR